jgi:signal peptidase I
MLNKWKKKLSLFWRGWGCSIVIALLIATSFKSAIADWNDVPTGSMKPTILEGDRIFVNKLAYDLKVPYTTWHLASWDDPKRGDIVVFFSPLNHLFFGETIAGQTHPVMITPARPSLRSFAPVIVPERHYFLMGDNRDNSADSRFFGFVERKQIVGRATAVVISLKPDEHYLPRWERFFQKLL